MKLRQALKPLGLNKSCLIGYVNTLKNCCFPFDQRFGIYNEAKEFCGTHLVN